MIRRVLVGILILAIPLLVVFFTDNYLIRLATIISMNAALALAWNLIGGFAGYPSFATAAFFGLGAYTSGVLQTSGFPVSLGWAGAMVVGAVFASMLGGAILHLRGHYFAIASLVMVDVLREVTNSWTGLTGGGMGLNLPLIQVGNVKAQAIFYFALMYGIAIAAIAISWWVSASRIGVALTCIEQNEDAAPLIGINTRRAKTFAFVLAGMISSGVGAVYASWVTYIDPTDVYDISLSVRPIIIALIGGVGTVFGPVIGAVVLLGLEEVLWRNLLQFHAGMLGLLVVILVLFLPGGLQSMRSISLSGLWRKLGMADTK